MSFSKNLKEEMSKTENLVNKEAVKFELIGYLMSSNVSKGEKETKFSTENEYNINRFARLLSNMKIENYKISVQGKTFSITVKNSDLKKINTDVEIETIDEIKWIVRGAYLGGGSINNPENKYHLEVGIAKKEDAEKIVNVLQDIEMKVSLIEKKNNYSIYIKDGEEISKFLALLGAHKAVLKFEEIRVQREMNNKINRIVNCETANLNKTINASVKQIETIKKLKKTGKFNNLPEELKEIANLREQNPNATSEELGNMLQKPISKSSVSHRFKKIEEYLQ